MEKIKKLIEESKRFIKESAKGIWLLLRYGPAKVVEWKDQAFLDPLTCLPNRRYLEKEGKKEMVRATRYQRPFSIVQVDIVGFKKINDEEGHPAGDEVLKMVAAFLESSCRESDTVFRTGGDEFTMLFPETYERGAERLIERIKNKAIFSPAGRLIELSYGIVAWKEKLSLEELQGIADVKMYEGRGRRLMVSKLS